VSDLFYEVTGDGPPVVLLHAGFVDSRMWDGQVPALAEHYTVVRYDQRGFGRSPRRDGEYSNVDDLRALLDELSFERAVLVAISRGGKIAIDFALEHPERVAALVLVASALRGFSFDVGDEELERRWNAAEAEGDLTAMAEIDLEVWAPLGDEGGLRQMAVENAHTNVEADEETEPERPAVARLAEIHVPTLVITGDDDVPAMDDIGDKLELEIGAQRVRMADCDHFPPIREPEAFNRIVLEFLGTNAAAAV
jgi:3-oxoadipate enol-lactonase